jgi:chaperonin GroES
MSKQELNIQPIAGTQNRVFVNIIKEEKRTDSGLYLAPKPEEKPTSGVVAAVSEKDNTGAEPIVQIGDFVYFNEFSGKEIEIEGITYLSMKENEIIARKIK